MIPGVPLCLEETKEKELVSWEGLRAVWPTAETLTFCLTPPRKSLDLSCSNISVSLFGPRNWGDLSHWASCRWEWTPKVFFFLCSDLISQQFWACPAIPAELGAMGALQGNLGMLMRALPWLRAMGVPSPAKHLRHKTASRMCLRLWKRCPRLSPCGPAKCRRIQ